MTASLVATLVDACEDACAAIAPRLTNRGNPADGPAEAQLEQALLAALPARGVSRDRLGARRAVVRHDWDPPPNGIDFYIWARPQVELALVAELKFDNVEERMWDLFKVLAARRLPGSPVALLVHGGSWKRAAPCAELFPSEAGRSVEVDTVDLVRSNRKQWEQNLLYPARVQAAPRRVIATSHLAGKTLSFYPSYELRVVTVEPASEDRVHFVDGWPAET